MYILGTDISYTVPPFIDHWSQPWW